MREFLKQVQDDELGGTSAGSVYECCGMTNWVWVVGGIPKYSRALLEQAKQWQTGG